MLEDGIRAATAAVRLHTEPLRDGTVYELRWGSQVDCRSITGAAERDSARSSRVVHPEQVAAYLAKYLTKATEDFGLPARVRSAIHARSVGASPHAVRIIETADADLAARASAYARLRDNLAHPRLPGAPDHQVPGLLGHLRPDPPRSPRASDATPGLDPDADVRQILDDDDDVPEGFELVSSWVYVGHGYLDLDQAASAVMSAAVSRTR